MKGVKKEGKMLKALENAVKDFLKKTENKNILIISHNDTDGVTSAAIMARTLERLDKSFSVRIVKQLEKDIIKELPEDKVLVFLDLASNSLEQLSKLKTEVFILDHHEIPTEIPKESNVHIVNHHMFEEEEISGAGVTYLFCKTLQPENKDLADLAVLGMIGDLLDKSISRLNQKILNDAEIQIKKGLLLYPATRPLNKALEYSSGIYIPGVTGSSKGASLLLREAGIERVGNSYKSLLELDEEEMSKLITAIMLRRNNSNGEDLVGKIYLLKFFNRLEDTREISATINACSSLNHAGIALSFCLGNKKAKSKAEKVYMDYKQHLVNALNNITTMERIEQKQYIIINAKDKVKDTIIGTIASILSHSKDYEEGKAIITMAHSEYGEKIKVSARIVGKNGTNIREVLKSVTDEIGGECGGHAFAAGCIIEKNKESDFIKVLQKKLEIELVKI